MFKTTISRPVFDTEGLRALGDRWRELASRSQASYFQNWGWVGCLAAERYPDPVLLEIHRDGELVALALFNKQPGRGRGGSWRLQESSGAALNSIFVEHNGPLLAVTDPVLRQALLADLFSHAMWDEVDGLAGHPRQIVLSGVGPDCAQALQLTGGVFNAGSVRMAPYADFTAWGADRPIIERLSRNTRHQLRRSMRLYEAEGPLVVRRAAAIEEGLGFLEEMIKLHDSTWRARGKTGAFATEAVRRFYRTLLADGIASGEVDMLRVTAGQSLVGLLMNFVHNGVVMAYQSGFNYAGAEPHQKPGLTCHFVAIMSYWERGCKGYDFLAGADRYKLSLANAQRWLHWVSAAPAWHPSSLGVRVRSLIRS